MNPVTPFFSIVDTIAIAADIRERYIDVRVPVGAETIAKIDEYLAQYTRRLGFAEPILKARFDQQTHALKLEIVPPPALAREVQVEEL